MSALRPKADFKNSPWFGLERTLGAVALLCHVIEGLTVMSFDRDLLEPIIAHLTCTQRCATKQDKISEIKQLILEEDNRLSGRPFPILLEVLKTISSHQWFQNGCREDLFHPV